MSILEADIELALNAIKSRDTSLPLELYPNAMPCGSETAWDKWESAKFEAEMANCLKFWEECLTIARNRLAMTPLCSCPNVSQN